MTYRRSPITFMTSWFPHSREHLAAMPGSVLLKFHDQVKYCPVVGATVNQVSNLNQGRAVSSPSILLIDEPGPAKNGKELSQISMHVGHCDYAVFGRRVRTGTRGKGTEEGRREETEEPHADWVESQKVFRSLEEPGRCTIRG